MHDALNKKNILNPRFETVSTVNLDLEILGYGKFHKLSNIQELNQIAKKIIEQHKDNLDENVIDLLFRTIKVYISHSIPKSSKLMTNLEDKKQRYIPWWIENVFIPIKERLQADISNENIKCQLTYEFIQEIHYDKILNGDLLKKFNSILLLYFFKVSMTEKRNLVLARRTLRVLNANSNIFKKSLIKKGQDLVDMDLIHYSIYGMKLGYNKYPINIVSCESKETTIARLLVYYSSLKIFQEFFQHSNKRQIKFNMGKWIHICDQTGRLKNIYHVNEVLNEAMNKNISRAINGDFD